MRIGGKMTISQLYSQSRKLLTHETADFDLSQLFHAHFGKRPGLIQPQEQASTEDVFIFNHKVKRLTDGYPLQYLLGEWEFYSVPLKVGEGVLIPRPDTETVVDTAISMLNGVESPVVADLCAGSGAISLALALNVKNVSVWAVELYDEAIFYLDTNIIASGYDHIISRSKQDVLDKLELPQLDMIVSNPPYLTAKEMEEIPTQVSFEPATALDGGEDGLKFYNAITQQARLLLKPNGAIVFECGYEQAGQISEILAKYGFYDIKVYKDLGKNDRCVCGIAP